jgi:hypothetical protein
LQFLQKKLIVGFRELLISGNILGVEVPSQGQKSRLRMTQLKSKRDLAVF